MKHTYAISGMTCGNCVAKVKSELLKIGDVTEAHIQLNDPQAVIAMQNHIPQSALQSAISKAGNYTISEKDNEFSNVVVDGSSSWLKTYKPLILICAYIIPLTLFLEFRNDGFDWHNWMQNFMAAFFLVFSFFKLLDLKGFASSYSTYDLIAGNWKAWGFIYPFVELALGIGYLMKLHPWLTNGSTFVIMSISLAGVLRSVLNKRRINCACLGAVFKLPMSVITLGEDGLMILMSGVMLFEMI